MVKELFRLAIQHWIFTYAVLVDLHSTQSKWPCQRLPVLRHHLRPPGSHRESRVVSLMRAIPIRRRASRYCRYCRKSQIRCRNIRSLPCWHLVSIAICILVTMASFSNYLRSEKKWVIMKKKKAINKTQTIDLLYSIC